MRSSFELIFALALALVALALMFDYFVTSTRTYFFESCVAFCLELIVIGLLMIDKYNETPLKKTEVKP